MEPAGRGTDLSPQGAGPRPQSLESRGVRQEVDLSEAGACKMTLGPERKTSGCGGECGELEKMSHLRGGGELLYLFCLLFPGENAGPVLPDSSTLQQKLQI